MSISVPYTVADDFETPGRPDLDRAHPDDAACDLRATEPCQLGPGGYGLVKTGIAMAIPEGYAGFVMPRSGLAAKHGVTVLNSPGLIDPGYRGDIGVVLINHGDGYLLINPGDRIAQLVIVQLPQVRFVQSRALPNSERGHGGFGSTGVA